MGRMSIAITVVALLGAGCGNGGEEARQSAERYCQAAEELNQRAEAIFADVDQDDPEESKRAQAEVYEAAQEVGLVEAAPDEIRDDVRTFIDGVYGPGDGVDGAAAEAAEKRVLAYEEEHCEQD